MIKKCLAYYLHMKLDNLGHFQNSQQARIFK